MNKQTPGPWTFGKWRNGTESAIGIYGDHDQDVADVPLNRVADARLIAAAPDLLAALRECRIFIAQTQAYTPKMAGALADLSRMVDAAIAKAVQQP